MWGYDINNHHWGRWTHSKWTNFQTWEMTCINLKIKAMLHKITLTKEGLHFKRNGEILHGNINVGTYHKEDIWQKHGGRRDKSGNLLVHYIYWLNIGTKSHVAYTLNDARDILEGCVVEVDLKY